MTQDWTQEPWNVGYHAYDVTACDGQMKICDIRGWGYLTGKGSGALSLNPEVAVTIQNANARRIVDCVNALAGIPDPAALVASHRQLVEVLEKIEKRCADYERINNITDKQAGTLRNCLFDARTALATARAVMGEAQP